MALDFSAFDDEMYATEHDEELFAELREASEKQLPWQIADLDLWKNYTNQRLYELDKALRKYLKTTTYQRRKYAKSKKQWSTTCPMVFECLFGRKPTSKDSQACVDLNRLLDYYCCRKTGQNFVAGKRVPRVYYFKPYAKPEKKKPFSLRLAIEERPNGPRNFDGYRPTSNKLSKPRPNNRELGLNENEAGNSNS